MYENTGRDAYTGATLIWKPNVVYRNQSSKSMLFHGSCPPSQFIGALFDCEFGKISNDVIIRTPAKMKQDWDWKRNMNDQTTNTQHASQEETSCPSFETVS